LIIRMKAVRKVRSRAARTLGGLGAAAVMAGVFIAMPRPALASSEGGWTAVSTPNPGSANDQLNGVAVLSSDSAWAVGAYKSAGGVPHTLIEHWNGTAWAHVPSPDPGGSSRVNILDGVAATSPGNVWAVGLYYGSGPEQQPLIEHWNGTTWTHVASPNPGGYSSLIGVDATSSSDVWAVGLYSDAGKPLAEHWNGTAWTRVPSPNPGGSSQSDQPLAVAATSATSIWAAGFSSPASGTATKNLALHCC
jgi:hypothetical protein